MVADTGELRRYRWNGSGWDTFEGGAHYRVVGNGWSRYSQAEHRNKVTVDEKGRLYEINDAGHLEVFIWDDAINGWTPETGGGKVIDTGWDQYDLLVAAGDGVLYARKPDGVLFRFRYHASSDRFPQYNLPVGHGWQMFNRIFSPGGDILYGTRADNGGELLWYRYFEDTNTWVRNVGTLVGHGWFGELDVVATTDDCRLTGFATPLRPTITPRFDARNTPIQGDDGMLNYFYVNSQGGLTHAKQRRADDLRSIDRQVFSDYSQFTGQPAVARHENGKLEVHAHSHDDADVRSKTQAVENGAWQAGIGLHGGRLLSDPVLVQGDDKLLASFAVDVEGTLWYRQQAAPNGSFTAWRQVGGQGLAGDLTVVRSGDGCEVVARHTDNSFRVARFAGGTLGEWRTLGGIDGTGTAAAVVHPDGKLQLIARNTGGKICTQRETSTGFPGTWQVIDGLTVAGAPAAVLTKRGTVEISVRGTVSLIYNSGQDIAGSVFRPWLTRDLNEAATDPSMISLSDGSWVVTWRNSQDEIFTYRSGFGITTST